MSHYIYELKNWPRFVWDQSRIAEMLIPLRHQQGRLMGGMEAVGFRVREEVLLRTLTEDVVKSSEIEGEILDHASVRSSVARHLGMDAGAAAVADRGVDGVVEMILDATLKFDQPLTKERLLSWHASLFPTGRSGFYKIEVGAWREGPVSVVSGAMGKETVHFEAPSAEHVDHEMALFLEWLNGDETSDLLLTAAIAHLWFVTIHPFADGNGRIGRAIADLVLARSERSSQRFYSLSAQIQRERSAYYATLESTQKNGLDITPWIEWFLGCLGRAIADALTTLEIVVRKTEYWQTLTAVPLNERQRKIINRLLDGFEGKLTTSKWAKRAKCSQDTAHRDIIDLVDKGVLKKNPEGGRATSYSLVVPKEP